MKLSTPFFKNTILIGIATLIIWAVIGFSPYKNSTLNIITGLCALFGAGLAFADEIGKAKYLNIVKTLGFKIITLLVAGILGIWATVIKDNQAEEKANKEEKAAKKEQREKDSINQVLLYRKDSVNKIYTDVSNRKIATEIAEALARYSLKIDSSNKKYIQVVKDSINVDDRTVVSVCTEDYGNITMTANQDSTEYNINIQICNMGKYPAYNLNIKTYLIFHELKPEYFLYQHTLEMPEKKVFAITENMNLHFKTRLLNWKKNVPYLYIKGDYTRLNKKGKQEIQEIFYFNYVLNRWTSALMTPPVKKLIKDLQDKGYY